MITTQRSVVFSLPELQSPTEQEFFERKWRKDEGSDKYKISIHQRLSHADMKSSNDEASLFNHENHEIKNGSKDFKKYISI